MPCSPCKLLSRQKPRPENNSAFIQEHDHQGKDNELLMPLASQEGVGTQSIRAREMLGDLLKFYFREAA
jgi:hypothetical protein